jgi:tetratricopeptide (TPR) repeat protein
MSRHTLSRRTGPTLVAALVGLALAGLGTTEARAHAGLHRDIERATRAIESDPESPDLYARRAHYYRLGGHLDQSLADLERGRELDPENLAVTVGLGLTLSALGRDAEAEAELNRFLSAGGRSVRAYSERAAVRARNGRFQEAIEDYTEAIKMKRDVELYVRRGALQEARGDLEAAALGYSDGFQNLGGAVTLRLALIRVETDRGEYDSALTYIDEELQRVPVKTNWYLHRADVLRAAGRTAEAELALNQALTEANQVIEKRATGIHLFSRAKVYVALGRTDLAKDDLEDVLLKSPRFSEAQELMQELEAQATTQED